MFTIKARGAKKKLKKKWREKNKIFHERMMSCFPTFIQDTLVHTQFLYVCITLIDLALVRLLIKATATAFCFTYFPIFLRVFCVLFFILNRESRMNVNCKFYWCHNTGIILKNWSWFSVQYMCIWRVNEMYNK